MSLDLFAVAKQNPQALALVVGEARFTYEQLTVEASRVAADLFERGVLEPSSVPVALVARPGLATLLSIYTLWSYGVAAFPVPARLPAAEQRALAARPKASALLDPAEISTNRDASQAPERRPLPEPSTPFTIVSTSGSTGAPKLIELTRSAFLASARASASNLPLSEHDRWLLCLPLSHIGGLSILTRCLLSASAVVAFDPGPGGLLANVLALAACLEREQISVVSLVPTVLDALLTLEPRWLPTPALRAVLLGGAATSPELLARARERGVPVLTTYGLTEACSQVTTTRLGGFPQVESGLVSSGRALAGIELKIDENQRICVRGPTLCTRFIDGQRPVDEHGWLRSEDRGYLNAAGELFVLGRTSDVIVTGGENVDPLRVEAALLGAAGVVSAVVFGAPDVRFGERVACALVLLPECDLHHARARLRETLAPYELPRSVVVLDALPLLENGKVDRAKIRAQSAGLLTDWLDRAR